MARQINAEIKHTHCEFNETRKQKNANQMRAHKIWNARPEKWWNLWILYCQCVRHFHSNLFALKMVDSAKCLWKQSKMTTIIAAFSINACKASLYPNKSTQKLIIYYSGFFVFFLLLCDAIRKSTGKNCRFSDYCLCDSVNNIDFILKMRGCVWWGVAWNKRGKNRCT